MDIIFWPVFRFPSNINAHNILFVPDREKLRSMKNHCKSEPSFYLPFLPIHFRIVLAKFHFPLRLCKRMGPDRNERLKIPSPPVERLTKQKALKRIVVGTV